MYFLSAVPPVLLLIFFSNPTTAHSEEDLCNWDLVTQSYDRSFTPWFRGYQNLTEGPGGNDTAFINNRACWWYADCIYRTLPETAKQQYAAVSIVMALIPLMLKDIAWPEKRIVRVTKEKPFFTQIVVRALGLKPVIFPEVEQGRKFRGAISGLLTVLMVLFLLVAYGLLAVMELYSKRSSIGCPVPAFIVLWFVMAILPAAIETAFLRYVAPRLYQKPDSSSDSLLESNMSGQDQHWIVQFCWGLYYSAGGLFFTSIMLTSVGEMFTWMLLAGLATAASKLLAFKLCGYWGKKESNESI